MDRPDHNSVSKNKWSQAFLGLVLLFQFFTFSGFADVSPTRSSTVQSEWVAHFSRRSHRRTVSFRKTIGYFSARISKDVLFRGIVHRQNNRQLTWWATVCAARVYDPLALMPTCLRPRSAVDEFRS